MPKPLLFFLCFLEDIISYQFFVQAADKGSPPNTQNVPVDVYVSHSKRQKRDSSDQSELVESSQETESAAAAESSSAERARRDTSVYSLKSDNDVTRVLVGPPTCVSPVENSVIELSETAPLGTLVFQVEVSFLIAFKGSLKQLL